MLSEKRRHAHCFQPNLIATVPGREINRAP
jgi:hypothetical protein